MKIIPACDLLWVYSITVPHYILVKRPRKYDVEYAVVNFFQCHCAKKISHMIGRIFSSMELDVYKSEFWGQFPLWDKSESCIVIKVIIEYGRFLKQLFYSINSWINLRSSLFLFFFLLLIIFPSYIVRFLTFFLWGILDKCLACGDHQFYLLVTFINPSLRLFQHLQNLGYLIAIPSHMIWCCVGLGLGLCS